MGLVGIRYCPGTPSRSKTGPRSLPKPFRGPDRIPEGFLVVHLSPPPYATIGERHEDHQRQCTDQQEGHAAITGEPKDQQPHLAGP